MQPSPATGKVVELSGDFPTTPGYYDTAIGSTYKDAFVMKISD